MTDFDQILNDLKQKRDEISLKIHLGTKELQDEWKELESKWEDFSYRANLDESMGRIKEAAGSLSSELREGYLRIKKALDSNS